MKNSTILENLLRKEVMVASGGNIDNDIEVLSSMLGQPDDEAGGQDNPKEESQSEAVNEAAPDNTPSDYHASAGDSVKPLFVYVIPESRGIISGQEGDDAMRGLGRILTGDNANYYRGAVFDEVLRYIAKINDAEGDEKLITDELKTMLADTDSNQGAILLRVYDPDWHIIKSVNTGKDRVSLHEKASPYLRSITTQSGNEEMDSLHFLAYEVPVVGGSK